MFEQNRLQLDSWAVYLVEQYVTLFNVHALNYDGKSLMVTDSSYLVHRYLCVQDIIISAKPV